MSQTVSPEARVGRRAHQKRRWDRENYVPSTARRDSRDARYRRIQDLWAGGYLLTEIADELETTKGTVADAMQRMRREGWDLPYRRRPR